MRSMIACVDYSDIISLISSDCQRHSSSFIVISFTNRLIKKSRPKEGGLDNDIVY